jgi:hypothetical protein
MMQNQEIPRFAWFELQEAEELWRGSFERVHRVPSVARTRPDWSHHAEGRWRLGPGIGVGRILDRFNNYIAYSN